MNSLSRLPKHEPELKAKSKNIRPGSKWRKYDELVWERSIEILPLLPKEFNSAFILPEGISSKKLRLYDLETTGLSGGSGNIAFLIGIAWEEESSFKITQLFLEDYPGEKALLRRYKELCPEDNPQISYNGLSFDYRILQTRFLMNQMPELHRKQIDLLYPTRRLWKNALENFTLGTVERELLGIHRINDLPGREAPDAWFAWLRGNPDRIQGVFQHNINDMISMARLLVLLEKCGLLSNLTADKLRSKRVVGHPNLKIFRGLSEKWLGLHNQKSLGEISSEWNSMSFKLSEEKMPSYWGIALQWGLSDASKKRSSLELGWVAKESRCGRELARLFKRERNYPASYSIWKSLNDNEKDFVSAIELSKLLEHHMKKPEAALHVLDGLEGFASSIKGRKDLLHRKKRLNRKIVQT